MKKLITLAAIAAVAFAKKMPVELGGVSCQTPSPLPCPDKDCPGAVGEVDVVG